MSPRRAGGYVLAEALVSAALAAMASTLAIVLLIWAAAAVDRAQSSVGAMRVMERVYEESRLLTPSQLYTSARGVLGRYSWSRTSGPKLDQRFDFAPAPVRITVRWTASGRAEERHLDALIAPGAAPPTR